MEYDGKYKGSTLCTQESQLLCAILIETKVKGGKEKISWSHRFAVNFDFYHSSLTKIYSCSHMQSSCMVTPACHQTM